MVPVAGSWSLGQLYVHLINDTKFYLEQAKMAFATDDNSNESAASFAITLFQQNAFPEEVIAGDPANAVIPQPASKRQLKDSLVDLKQTVNELQQLLLTGDFKGKTKHPGLGYFSAAQWLQFADMHFRHHLMQKKKIDDLLMSIQ